MHGERVWTRWSEFVELFSTSESKKWSVNVSRDHLSRTPKNLLKKGGQLYIGYGEKRTEKETGISRLDIERGTIENIKNELEDMCVYEMKSSLMYPELGIWIATNGGLANLLETGNGELSINFIYRETPVHSLYSDGDSIGFVGGNFFYKYDLLTELFEVSEIKENVLACKNDLLTELFGVSKTKINVSDSVVTTILLDKENSQVFFLLDESGYSRPSILKYFGGKVEPIYISDFGYPNCGVVLQRGSLYLGNGHLISWHKALDPTIHMSFTTVPEDTFIPQTYAMEKIATDYHEIIFYSQGKNLYVTFQVTQVQAIIEIDRITYDEASRTIPPFLYAAPVKVNLSDLAVSFIYEIYYSTPCIYLCTNLGVLELNTDFITENIL